MPDIAEDFTSRRRDNIVNAYRELSPGLQALFSERVSLGLRLAQEITEVNAQINNVQKDIAGLKKSSNLGLVAAVVLWGLAWLFELTPSPFWGPLILLIYLLLEMVAVPLHLARLEGFTRHRDSLRVLGHALDLSSFHGCLNLDKDCDADERQKAFNTMHGHVLYSLTLHDPSATFIP